MRERENFEGIQSLRMSRRRFIKACTGAGIAALGMGSITLSGCLQEKERIASGVYIEGASGGDAETLNWILAADATSFQYAGLTLDGLAAYDNKFNVQLRWLKKDVEVSEDGLVYTVALRDDLKWSDGKKVKAGDFVYTMKNLMFADWLNYNYKGDWMEEVEGKAAFVEPEVKNESTFTITRQTVYPEFVYTIYDLLAYPEHIVKKYEGDVEAFTRAEELNTLAYTGNLGPYKFSEWIRNDRYVVVRNPDYYLGRETKAPYFEKVIIKLFGTSAARQAALEAEDITYTSLEPEQVKKFTEMTGKISVYTVPTRTYTLIEYNHRSNGWEGLRNKKVRQALSMAVSKESIIKNIRLGFGEPAFSFIPKTSPWYVDEGLLKFGTGELYSKEKAKEMLREAGFEKPEKLRIVTNSGSRVAESVAFFVKQELAEIGIESELSLVPWETLLRKYIMNKVQNSEQEPRYNNGKDAISEEAWDLMITAHGTDPLQPSGSEVFYATDGGLNSGGYSNKAVDALFKKAKSKEALEKEARRNIYAELSKVIAEDQPVDFLYFPTANHGFQAKVKGIDPGISLGYNFHEWYFGE